MTTAHRVGFEDALHIVYRASGLDDPAWIDDMLRAYDQTDPSNTDMRLVLDNIDAVVLLREVADMLDAAEFKTLPMLRVLRRIAAWSASEPTPSSTVAALREQLAAETARADAAEAELSDLEDSMRDMINRGD